MRERKLGLLWGRRDDGAVTGVRRELVVRMMGPTFAVATWGNVMIQIWENGPAPSAETQRAMARILAEQKRARPDGNVLVLAVVAEHAGIPEGESRRAAAELPEHFDFFVAVHEGTGFRGSVIRAVLGSMAMLSRVRARWDVRPTITEGAALLASKSGGEIQAGELWTVITELRAKIAEKAL
jgi:hypothetical protein